MAPLCRTRFHALTIALAAMLALWPAAASRGQAGDSGGEIEISVGSFGVGGICRQGEWVGVRVVTSDRAATPRQIVIRVAIPDIDGDTPTYERSVASNPGVRQGAWLYFRLPTSFQPSDRLVVSVHEADEDGQRLRAGRLIARQTISPREVVSAGEAIFGIIGGGPVGLDQYQVKAQGMLFQFTPGGHEGVEVSATLKPEEMCDRWMGLMQFDTLVWSGDQPGKLDADRALALKEWVHRGGHLVIVMPPVGQSWIGDQTYNPLADILPKVTVNRLEGISLEPYRPLLASAGSREIPLPDKAVVHEFTPARDAAPGEAVPILGNPPGRGNPRACVAVRRLVGTGAVTLVGIDLANKGLQMHGRPQADILWHRILGRRGKLYSPTELTSPTPSPGTMTRSRVVYDMIISEIVNMSASASRGVLLGFVVFISYWLVAAPVSYGVLRRWGMTKHTWVAYAGAAGLFTGIAWGGVTLIKPRSVSGSHVTLMDYVYGGDGVARTRTWASMLIPWYGSATVSVGEPDEPKSDFQNTVAPWDSSTEVASGDFPDARPYVVESRAPDSLTFPTRSTVKQLQFDWAGGPRWLMLRPVAPDPATGKPPEDVPTKNMTTGRIEFLPSRGGAEGSTLRGFVANELPAPLQRVRVYVVRGQRRLSLASGTSMISDVEFWQALKDLAPGELLDLEVLTRAAPAEVKLFDGNSGVLPIDAGGALGGDRISQAEYARALEGLAYINQLPPPMDINRPSSAALRQFSHGWDLGVWFTHPCVIITGQVGDPVDPKRRGGPCPTPIYVDGKAAPMSGVTVVRWIYPLAADPPAYQ